jgi:type IV secretion system protein VirB9
MNRLTRSFVSTFLAFARCVSAETPPSPPPQTAKVVFYGERDVIAVKAKVRFTTLIVLPKREQILDFTCGDKEFWVVNGSQNFAYVKPAKAGSHTNLNLIAASGNVYSFVLSEVTDATDSEPDLKIFVEPKDESLLSSATGQPRFATAQQVEDYRQQVEIAKAEARDVKQAAQTAIEHETNQFRAEYPANLKFPYRVESAKRPFNVTAMYTDGKFTYIQARPEEPPALYELKDGKPNLIQFEFRNGTYVAAKALDSGYLAIGKRKLSFVRLESDGKGR